MLYTYLKLAFRSIARSRTFSFINIFGLALGLVAFALIAQYVSFQLSFDRFHDNAGGIYRVAYERSNGDTKNTSAKNLIGIRALIEQNFPEVQSTGFWPVPANTDFTFRYDGKVRTEPGRYLFADSNFLKVFNDRLVRGDLKTVMNDPHNLIISERMALKIFGDRDPVGLPIEDIVDSGNDGPELIVAGVMKDFPENSHFHGDFLSPMGHAWDTVTYYWDVPSFYTYIRVSQNEDVERLEARLNELLATTAIDHPDMKGVRALIQPMTDIHLQSNLSDEIESNSSSMLIYVLFSIGVIILVIAWINYINLETAQFIRRSKEIGIRRIIGSTRTDLMFQFFVRYACLNVFAIILAATAMYVVLPYLNSVLGEGMGSMGLLEPRIWILSLALFIGGSIFVGVYPALRLMKIEPTRSLKGFSMGRSGSRRALVVVQFSISIVLIGFLIVVRQQLEFMQITNKKIEIDKVIAIKNPMAYVDDTIDDASKFNELATKLSQYASVQMVSTSSAIPGTEIGFTLVNEMKRHAGDPYDPTRFKLLFIDYNYIPLYKLKLLAGRNYHPENGVEENKGHIILNESAIHALGFASPKQAVGERVHFPLWKWMNPDTEIIGVVEDYHHEAIKKPVMPMIFFLNNSAFQQVFYTVKLSAGGDARASIDQIERTWRDVYPERPFDYFFIDDFYDQQFKSELQFARIFEIFSGIAIMLACLGIFGMTIFEASARLKEISVRKVLGASVQNLLWLLSNGYFKIIAISALVACPLIYYFGHSWLENYPVQVDMSAVFFAAPIVVIIVVVIMTSFVQTFKAARTNPVNHLRAE